MQSYTVTVTNCSKAQFKRNFTACADERFQLVTMPMSWKNDFGAFEQEIEQTWSQDCRVVRAGPVKFQIENFGSYSSEADFVEGLNHASLGRVALSQMVLEPKAGGAI